MTNFKYRKVVYLAMDPKGKVHTFLSRHQPKFEWAALGRIDPEGEWRVLGWSHSRLGATQMATRKRGPGEIVHLVTAYARKTL